MPWLSHKNHAKKRKIFEERKPKKTKKISVKAKERRKKETQKKKRKI